MRRGGESDPRNKALMKMFNLINIGERAGSGVPDIFRVWEEQGWKEPVIEERFGEAARTSLLLSYEQKENNKTIEKNNRKKQATKTVENKVSIMAYITQHGRSKTSEIASPPAFWKGQNDKDVHITDVYAGVSIRSTAYRRGQYMFVVTSCFCCQKQGGTKMDRKKVIAQDWSPAWYSR